MTVALRALDWEPPRFLLRGLPITIDGGRVYTRDDLVELERVRQTDAILRRSPAPAGAQEAQDAPTSVEGHDPTPEAETAACEPPGALASGVGQRLHRDIAQRMAERNFEVEAHPLLPLAPPSDCPVLIRGVATRTEIDSMRTMVLPHALSWDELPPILLRHGEPCGECLSLEYSLSGTELIVVARIDLPEARRMPGLSINFVPEAYEFVDKGFWHFRVSNGRLIECSVTDRPCLRSARITARTPAIAMPGPYQRLADQVARMKMALAA
jgi:hypothetical protein